MAKAQSKCSFCEVAGNTKPKEITPGIFLAEPFAEGHTTLVTKKHVGDAGGVVATMLSMTDGISLITRDLGRYNLIISKYSPGTQSVTHIRADIVPRLKGELDYIWINYEGLSHDIVLAKLE